MASLFARKHTGDRAFTSLVESQRGPLERYVRGLGASHEDAEEIASAALLRAYLNAPPTLEDADGQRAWLRTVARNLWIDRTRRLRVKLVTEEASFAEQASHAPAADAGRLVETADEARAVLAAMALLAPSQRAMLYLREVRGLSYAEIADELGTTLPAVESTLHRARHSLARSLNGKSRSRTVRAMAMAPLFLVHRWSGRASAAVHAVPQAVAVKIAIPAVVALTAGGLVVTHHVPALSLGGTSHHRAAKAHAAPGRAGHHALAAGRHAGRSHHATRGAVVASAERHRIHGHASANAGGGAGAGAATSLAAASAATTPAVHGPVKATRAHGPGHGQALGHTAATSHGHTHTPPVKSKPVKTRPGTGKTTHAAPPAGSKAHTQSVHGQTPKSPKSPPPTAQGPANRTTPSGKSGPKTTPGGNASANGHAAPPATTPAASVPSSSTGTGNAAPPGQGKKSS